MKRSSLQRLINKVSHSNAVRILLFGYGAYIIIAWLLLCLPISWQDQPISPLDNVFIATSAVSTTGLVTVNTPEAYSFFGELVIALAFQVGGLGYMTLGSFALISSKNSLSYLRQRVGSAVFSLPQGFHLKDFIQHTVIFTVLVEIAGILSFFISVIPKQNPNQKIRYWKLKYLEKMAKKCPVSQLSIIKEIVFNGRYFIDQARKLS